MDSPRARFLRLCRRCRVWDFLNQYGEDVQAVNEYGENLLTCLSGDWRLSVQALMLGWPADVVDDGCYPCVHSPLYEVADCAQWEMLLLMLRRPLRREALESALYWACHAWSWPEKAVALRALRGLIAQLGGFCPEKLPQLMELLIMGGVYPLIPEALAAGYELPPADSPWWGGDEGAWSSGDQRENAAWRRALLRFAAERPQQPGAPCERLPKRSRRFRRKGRFARREREWLHLLRACC